MANGSARQRLERAQAGQSLAELAVVLVLLLFLTFGIIDAGRLIFAYNMVSSSARDGVRWAVVRGFASGQVATADDINTFVKNRIVGIPVDVTVTWNPNNDPGGTVAVKVQSQWAPSVLFPMVPTSITLASSSQMVISR